MEQNVYAYYTSLLQDELITALGCTEPIAIAYAAAKAREVLGHMPDRIVAACSGNIVKNVKSVTVPATNGMKGIASSAIVGAVGGDASRKLEVLTAVTSESMKLAKKLLSENICTVELLEGVPNLNIVVSVFYKDESALVELRDGHTNIVRIEKNGRELYVESSTDEQAFGNSLDADILNLDNILTYAQTVPLEVIRPMLRRQLDYNLAISKEGLQRPYGANVGKTILKHLGHSWEQKAMAYAAAGSDARMNGCSLPVVINSGSGNQGITVSIPVYIYAQEIGANEETLIRALAVSNLTAIYQKKRLGKLSAYCGAVSAATASGAAIAWLSDATPAQISQTITNTIANVSGIVCDGAKASCAAKIASSVSAAITGYYMAMDGNVFQPGEGLVGSALDDTVESYTTMGREGMATTDVTILKMMLDESNSSFVNA